MQVATAFTELLFDPALAVEELVCQLTAKLGNPAGGLGVLFAHVEMDHAALLAALQERLGIRIVGCTTYSEGTEAGFHDASVSLMVLAGEGLRFALGRADGVAADPAGAAERAFRAARAQLSEPPALCLVFPDSSLCAGSEAVLGALNRLAREEGCLVAGGEPGDNGQFRRTFQFHNDEVLSDGVVLALLAGDLKPVAATRSGWRPLSPTLHVTAVDRNLLLSLDDEPAIAAFQRHIGTMTDPDILATYPLLVGSPEAEVIRSVFRLDPASGAAITAAAIPVGSEVRIGFGQRDDVLDGVRQAAAAVSGALEGRAPRALLFFSCGGRKLVLGLDVDREIEILRACFDAPVCGFYSYGEIGPGLFTTELPEPSRFFNTSFVLVAI